MQTINRKQTRTPSYGALLAGATFVAALAFAAPGEAFAACGGGTGGSTGTHAPSTGTGGTHSGSTPSAGSAGTGSCAASATAVGLRGGGLAPSLAGVHTGAITGNGGKRGGSTTSSTTASTLTTSRTAAVANTTRVAGGAVHTGGGGHFFHAGKRR